HRRRRQHRDPRGAKPAAGDAPPVRADSGQSLSGERFGDAVRWAIELHGDQVRKGTAIPYVSHLLAVAGLVLEGGGNEDEAIAAVLHDALEDTDATAGDIEERFGRDV